VNLVYKMRFTLLPVIGFFVSFLLCAQADAHKYAASSFEARTSGNHVNISFRLDGTSVVELVKRSIGEDVSKRDLNEHEKLILDYVTSHFKISNNGVTCKPGESTGFEYSGVIDKVVISYGTRCQDKLDEIVLESSIFIEEETTHRTLGTFIHKRALERYVMSERMSAVIHVNKLRQAPRRDVPGGPVRLARPPSGAFDGVMEKQKANEAARQNARAKDPGASISEDVELTAQESKHAKRLGTGFLEFLWQGIVHILAGLDHVLFVITLVLAVYRWKDLALVVTSFTVAHSITLVLATLDLVSVPPLLVEPLIAASIIYVAVENTIREKPKARALVTFLFGLFHGLGFSSVLRDLGLPSGDLAGALVGFNVGVEIGQLMIVAPLFPLLILLARKEKTYLYVRRGAGVAVALVATFWMVQRVMESFSLI
jgi:hydrogenase/urease accessory protein HupE